MKKTLAVIAGVVVVAVAGLLAYAATKPDTFRVQRSASINAPPEKVFPLINDFKSWSAWSPWETKDPGMKRSYGATTSGKGATYAWDGDSNVGAGNMEITDAPAPSKVRLNLNMTRPMEARNVVEFTLQRKGNATEVTWTMNGNVPFVAKVIHVVFDMDKMVGGEFDAGLAKLKAAAEK